MTQKTEGLDQNTRTAIINILHVSQKTEETKSMLRRDTEVRKNPNWTSRHEKYTRWS